MSTLPTSPASARTLQTRDAFDSVAQDYDGPLGNNLLVQGMRRSMWDAVQQVAVPGARLLDLGCGTGLDAAHFADLGYHVTAIDASPAMVKRVHERTRLVRALALGIEDLDRLADEQFDIIYSDLGALNCLAELHDVARACARMLARQGYLVFSVIGRLCPWEIVNYLLRGDAKRATIRFAQGQVPVSLNGYTAWTSYYSARELRQVFQPFFVQHSCRALNLFLPPPYLIGPVQRHPAWFKPLAWLDRRLAHLPLLNQAGDHFLMVLRHYG